MSTTKVARRQWLVTVAGIAGTFTTKTGGNITAANSKVFDGGSPTPQILSGIPEVDNVTVGRPWDSNRDASIVKTLRPKVGSFETTITIQQTDRDFNAIGDPIVYAGALLVGLTFPEADSSSGDASTFDLEFAVASVA